MGTEDDDSELQDLPGPVEQCARSIGADNPDMDKSTKIAICQDMHNQGLLADPNESEASGLRDGGPDPESRREASALRDGVTRLFGQRTPEDPGKIERVEEDGQVRYKNIMLLAPGTWTDDGSGETIFYGPDGIKASAENWVDNTLNLLHDMDNDISEAGEIDTDTVHTDDEGNLYSDLVLSMNNAASEYADELLQSALESGGQKGIGGPSVEIPEDRVEWNPDRGVYELVEAKFSGVGLVSNPASKPADFAKQTATRAVALSAAETDDIRVMQRDKAGGRHAAAMRELEELREKYEDLERRLQDEDEEEETEEGDGEEETEEEEENEGAMEALSVADQLANDYVFDEGFEASNTLTELVAWAEENRAEDAEALTEVVEAFLQDHEPDSPDEASVEMLMAWIEEVGGRANEGTEGDASLEGSSDLMGSVMDTLEAMDERLGTLEALEEKNVASRLSELEADKKTLADRLDEIEDEPTEPRSLAEPLGAGESEGEEASAAASGGFTEDAGYISR